MSKKSRQMKQEKEYFRCAKTVSLVIWSYIMMILKRKILNWLCSLNFSRVKQILMWNKWRMERIIMLIISRNYWRSFQRHVAKLMFKSWLLMGIWCLLGSNNNLFSLILIHKFQNHKLLLEQVSSYLVLVVARFSMGWTPTAAMAHLGCHRASIVSWPCVRIRSSTARGLWVLPTVPCWLWCMPSSELSVTLWDIYDGELCCCRMIPNWCLPVTAQKITPPLCSAMLRSIGSARS